MDFPEYVKAHRHARHWSQGELSRRSGLRVEEISRAERGVRPPTLRHVRGYAKAFSAAPLTEEHELKDPASWTDTLVDLGEAFRESQR